MLKILEQIVLWLKEMGIKGSWNTRCILKGEARIFQNQTKFRQSCKLKIPMYYGLYMDQWLQTKKHQYDI